MLLWLSEWLAQDVRAFNVFNYLTLRTVLAALTALLISWMAGPSVIRWLAAKKIGQAVRTDGPQTHLVKSGTPTMGGVLILIATGLSTLLWGDPGKPLPVWIVLLVTLGTGAVAGTTTGAKSFTATQKVWPVAGSFSGSRSLV